MPPDFSGGIFYAVNPGELVHDWRGRHLRILHRQPYIVCNVRDHVYHIQLRKVCRFLRIITNIDGQ